MRLLAVVLALLAGAARAEVRRFAVIVAENRPLPGAEGLATLRYADDDGARYWSLLRAVGAEVALLAVLDEETQRRRPDAAAAARPPTRAALARTLDEVNRRMAAARAAGHQVDFYFVFAGHGEVGPNGEGRVHLRDGFLTRGELIRDVVAASRADFNHLIIDACHASAMVFRRGGDDGYRPDDYRETIARYLHEEDLDAHPDTGVLLAATASHEAHEWEVFGAGVFSHEVRSGLAGAADTNGDGLIEYAELSAFVAAANLAVEAPEARPQVVARPPLLNRHRPLIDIADGPRHFLQLPAGFRGRAWLENDRGERYADFHASGEAPVVLALAPAPHYYLRRPGGEARVPLPGPGTVDGARLEWRDPALGARGALDDAFRRQLYEVPFGPSFFRGYVARSGSLGARVQRDAIPLPGVIGAAEPGTRFGAWPYVAGGVALAAGAGAVALGLSARSDLDAFEAKLDRTGLADPELQARVDAKRTWTNVLAVAAGLAGAATVTLLVLDGPGEAPSVTLGAGPGGAVLGGAF